MHEELRTISQTLLRLQRELRESKLYTDRQKIELGAQLSRANHTLFKASEQDFAISMTSGYSKRLKRELQNDNLGHLLKDIG